MENQTELINYVELSKRLNASQKTIRKHWKSWPHVIVGQGETLRCARFDYEEVVKHLKEKSRIN